MLSVRMKPPTLWASLRHGLDSGSEHLHNLPKNYAHPLQGSNPGPQFDRGRREDRLIPAGEGVLRRVLCGLG